MTSAQLLAARRGGTARFPWLDEDVSVPLDHRSIRQKAIRRLRRVGGHAPICLDDHDFAGWRDKTTRLERTRPAPTVPLPMPAELAEAIEDLDDVTAYAEENRG